MKRHSLDDPEYVEEENKPDLGYHSFLTLHQGDVWQWHEQGMKPGEIAKKLTRDYKLPSRSLKAKHVSDWLNYHKKSKQHKTYSVSASHGNMQMDLTDNCTFFLVCLTLLGYDDAQQIANAASGPIQAMPIIDTAAIDAAVYSVLQKTLRYIFEKKNLICSVFLLTLMAMIFGFFVSAYQEDLLKQNLSMSFRSSNCVSTLCLPPMNY